MANKAPFLALWRLHVRDRTDDTQLMKPCVISTRKHLGEGQCSGIWVLGERLPEEWTLEQRPE